MKAEHAQPGGDTAQAMAPTSTPDTTTTNSAFDATAPAGVSGSAANAAPASPASATASAGASDAAAFFKPPVVIAGVIVAVLLLAVALFLVAGRSCSARHDGLSRISITAPGLDEKATPTPVRAVGTDANGNSIDQTGYMDIAGNGFSVPDGTYQLSFPASPIASDGSLYRTDGVTVDIQVSNGEASESQAASKPDNATAGVGITFDKADPTELETSQIASAREKAIDSGENPGKVDSLLEPVENTVNKLWDGAPFGPSQYYRGKLYAGYLRTNQGDKPVKAIPTSEEPPVLAEQFLFTNGFYYYVEPFPGNGTTAVKLHRINLESKEDTVLSEDVCSGEQVFYSDGLIAYLAFGSRHVKVLNAETGEVTTLDFNMQQGLSRFIGIHDGYAYAVATHTGEPTIVYRCNLKSGSAEEALKLDVGASVIALREGVLVTSVETKVTAFDLKGTELWSAAVPVNLNSWQDYYRDSSFYFKTGKNIDSSTKEIVRLGVADGKTETFATGIPYVMQVIYADSEAIYFCGMESTETSVIVGGDFNTYACNKADGTVKKLPAQAGGSNEAAAGEASGETQAPAAAEQEPTPEPEPEPAPEPSTGNSSTHIKTADFEFDIPAYWVGKVDWVESVNDYGYACVSIFPKGLDEKEPNNSKWYRYYLVHVQGLPLSIPSQGGDIGNGKVDRVESSSKAVSILGSNWGYKAYECNMRTSYALKAFDPSKVRTCVDLSTGGQMTYDECTHEQNLTSLNYLKSQFIGAVTVL